MHIRSKEALQKCRQPLLNAKKNAFRWCHLSIFTIVNIGRWFHPKHFSLHSVGAVCTSPKSTVRLLGASAERPGHVSTCKLKSPIKGHYMPKQTRCNWQVSHQIGQINLEYYTLSLLLLLYMSTCFLICISFEYWISLISILWRFLLQDIQYIYSNRIWWKAEAYLLKVLFHWSGV